MRRAELTLTALLLPLDLLGVGIAVFVANHLRTSLDILPLAQGRISYPGYLFLLWYFPLLVGFYSQQRLYNLRETGRFLAMPLHIFSGTASAAIGQFVVILVGRNPWVLIHIPVWGVWAERVSILTIVYFWLITIVSVVVLRVIYRMFVNILLRRGIAVRRVMLIGASRAGQELSQLFSKPERGYLIEHHIVADYQNVPMLIGATCPDEVIQVDPEMPTGLVVEIIEACHDAHADFSFAPNLFEVLAANVRVSRVGSIPLMELRRTPLDGWGKIVKRAVDVILTLLFMVAAVPVMLVAALLIKISDGGPVLFSQERVSPLGNFRILKLRSMVADAEALEDTLRSQGNERDTGPLFKLRTDPRVTRLGKFLRASRIDELPQLINVLRGDMSLVGPRPHLPKEVSRYARHHRSVLTVKPGLTGIAQISGSASLSFEDEVRLDVSYIENWSLLKDLEILVKTPFVIMFARDGAY